MMMKKCLAIVLSLSLLLGGAALAETAEKNSIGSINVNGAFTLMARLPEGYYYQPLTTQGELMIAGILPLENDGTRPMMTLSICFDELLSEVERLNDLNEDALAQIAATFTAEDQVDISYMETAHGTKLMVVKETADTVDYVDFYTIYKGYEIEFVLNYGTADAPAITEEQIATAIQFLSDLDFVPAQ